MGKTNSKQHPKNKKKSTDLRTKSSLDGVMMVPDPKAKFKPKKFKVTGKNKRPPLEFENGKTKSMTPRQIRERVRRRGVMTEEEMGVLYRPLHEWDIEELAACQPKNKNGHFQKNTTFQGYMGDAFREKVRRRFERAVKERVNEMTVPALHTLSGLLENNDLDDKGRPFVPASVKAGVAQYLIEHTIGKPTQKVEADISVRLQGILAAAVVNPTPADGQTSAMGHNFPVAGLPGFSLGAGSAPVVDEDVIDLDEDDVTDLPENERFGDDRSHGKS